MNKTILWSVIGVVVAIGAIWLLMSPSTVTDPYDKAVSLARNYGANADERQAGVTKSLAASVPVGADTDVCLAARKALQQQRITVKAIKALPPREEASVTTEAQVAELMAARVKLLLQSVDARTTACGGPEEGAEQ
jgi:hypothetical protein